MFSRHSIHADSDKIVIKFRVNYYAGKIHLNRISILCVYSRLGYFLLPDEAKSWHNIRTANVIYTISKQESFTILVTPKNFLKDLRNLEHYVGMEDMIKAALVALATFSLVQYKHLQHHAQHRLPTFQLIFVHVIESLVFVPVCTHICNGPVPGPKILIKDWASLRPIWQRHRVSLHLFYKKRCSLPFASYKNLTEALQRIPGDQKP
ncbi:hypothetical protein YC2023_033371 [Brassica napus]